MHGTLEIGFHRRDGETHVDVSRARAPFHYLPPSRNGRARCELTIVNSSGGILGGDRLEMTIRLGPRSRVDLRTQAATRVYRSDGALARSLQRFRLDRGARLEWFPDEVIPFAGSRFVQETELDLGPGAVALVSEIVAAGRLARGERFAFRRLAIDFRCLVSGRLALRERYDLEPERRPLGGAGILGDAAVWASFYWLTDERSVGAERLEAIHQAMASVPGGRGGATAGPIGVVGRAVGDEVEPLREAIARARALVPENS